MTDLATRADSAEGDKAAVGVESDDAASEAQAQTTVIDGPEVRDGPAVPDGPEGPEGPGSPDDPDEPGLEWAPAEPRPKKRHLALWIGIPVGVVLLGVGVTSAILIAPGVTVGGVPIGGMTPGAAADAIQSALDETAVVLTTPEGDVVLTGAELGAVVDAKALAATAYGEHPLWNIGAWNPEPIPATVALEADEASATIRDAAPALYVDPVDATVAFDPAVGAYVVVAAVPGTGIDVDAVGAALSEALAAGDASIEIPAPSQEVESTVTTAEAEAGAAKVNAMVAASGFYVGEERTVPVDAATTASWLTVKLDAAGAPDITADAAAIQPFIDALPAAINRDPVNAATIANNAGRVLRTATDGVAGRAVTGTDGLADQFATQLAQGNAALQVPVAETPFQTLTVVRLLEVDLSEQRLYLKENGAVVDSWAISSGKSVTPTYTGRYTINSHVRTQTMRGPERDANGNPLLDAQGNRVFYETANVPWITYFNGDQAFHGVYWHSNWGRRMSHGCVGMPIPRAQQVYEWSANGTDVWIHD
ncbi:MAG TPA: L,D-transpeptidase [Microbacterium sp.]|uniref:L,D-transpeptidase n=1 Tax=Microbacterium sp. TaxID=51671 RepID=UPI002CE52B76|nr:L,D-transpeptidase [Microbacterium sp.]HWI30182.1 L,D-transpeptidase [Microbacterium sp.]